MGGVPIRRGVKSGPRGGGVPIVGGDAPSVILRALFCGPLGSGCYVLRVCKHCSVLLIYLGAGRQRDRSGVTSGSWFRGCTF